MRWWTRWGDPEERVAVEGRLVVREYLSGAAGWVEVERHECVSAKAAVHLAACWGYWPPGEAPPQTHEDARREAELDRARATLAETQDALAAALRSHTALQKVLDRHGWRD